MDKKINKDELEKCDYKSIGCGSVKRETIDIEENDYEFFKWVDKHREWIGDGKPSKTKDWLLFRMIYDLKQQIESLNKVTVIDVEKSKERLSEIEQKSKL